MTMNVHLLQHLPSCVRQFGPLWSFPCFAFENLNGFLSGCIHGNRYTPQQVCFITIEKFMNLSCSLLLRHISLQVKDIYGIKFKLTLEKYIKKSMFKRLTYERYAMNSVDAAIFMIPDAGNITKSSCDQKTVSSFIPFILF